MTNWIKRLHTWFGLVNFVILLIFGVTGLLATARRPGEQKQPPAVVTETAFTLPPGVVSDRDAADAIRRRLDIPAAGFNFRRDERNLLVATYYTPSGPRRVTLLEKQGLLRIETRRNSIWQYFSVLHETLPREAGDVRIRLWGYYTELSSWCLLGMSLSGLWLWLSSRPRLRWAWASFLAGSGAFALLWLLSR
jgi:hypothetical protein